MGQWEVTVVSCGHNCEMEAWLTLCGSNPILWREPKKVGSSCQKYKVSWELMMMMMIIVIFDPYCKSVKYTTHTAGHRCWLEGRVSAAHVIRLLQAAITLNDCKVFLFIFTILCYTWLSSCSKSIRQPVHLPHDLLPGLIHLKEHLGLCRQLPLNIWSIKNTL